MERPLYLTTTLPYVNADPHIGFALELVQADVLARLARLRGREVFFNTGTDEHGQKIYEAAQKAGEDVRQYVDHYAEEFQKLRAALALSNDAFIRTTSPEHHRAAQELWRRCESAGDIYKKAYEGLYCVGCEKFLTPKELAGGLCHIHGKAPVLLKEENYFFRFSKYADRLLTYLSREDSVTPLWRREEAKSFVKEGLEDFSVSREKRRLAWGVPVPGDESQVMYVWFDALTNYISTLGWPDDARGNFKKFWEEGETLQLAGKDQVRFQSLVWQAMLFSAGIKNTDRVFYHGFINSGGQKMSKSLGNVISPYELVEKYGTDATRYLLLRHMHPFEDSDVTWERLDEWYTAGLVNGIGNLVSRVMKLAETHLAEPVETLGETRLIEPAGFDFNLALDTVWTRVQELDRRIAEEKPFDLVKTDSDKGKALISELVSKVYEIARQLEPFMPETSQRIVEAVRANHKPENLFPRLS